MISPDPTFVDRSIVVYDAICPTCEHKLEWAVEMPPIPMTLFSWFNPDGDGERILECPKCESWLPEGDLTKAAA